MFKSRRQGILLLCYLSGLAATVISMRLAISIGVVASLLWLMNHDEVSYQKNMRMKRGN